jgi:hypothetical protein
MFKKRQLNALFKMMTDTEMGEMLLESMFGRKFYAGHSIFKAESFSKASHKHMVRDREKLADVLRNLADALDANLPKYEVDA